MAVYDLTHTPADEQHRWHAQLCPHHATAQHDSEEIGRQVFDPHRHGAHIRTASRTPATRPWHEQPLPRPEITLTHPLAPADFRNANRTCPLAAHATRTRLLALSRARRLQEAVHRLNRLVEGRPPVDVITTHYPTGTARCLSTSPYLGRHPALNAGARNAGHSPSHHLELALLQNLADHAQHEDHRAETAVRHSSTPPPPLDSSLLSPTP